jgi:hypothetical protein
VQFIRAIGAELADAADGDDPWERIVSTVVELID